MEQIPIEYILFLTKFLGYNITTYQQLVLHS
jgi:hypothetical protein